MTENILTEPLYLYCQRCRIDGPATLTRSGKHVRADCGDCGRYIKFVPVGGTKTPKKPSEWTYASPPCVAMRSQPPSEAQLAVIRKSKYSYVQPESRFDAWLFIGRIVEAGK